MARRDAEFQTIRSEGGLLPPDLLRRLLDPKSGLEGTKPEDYGLAPGERLNEAVTQSWNRLQKHWAEFRSAAANLSTGDAGTGLTNDKWTLPLLRELGFGFLTATVGPEVGGRAYPISRFHGPVPIHLVGCGVPLDRRSAGVAGAARVNPHGLVQDFLNRSPDHLWAIVSNGTRLRVLRDNQALSRQSFLEFDLEGMFGGEVYSDFVVLWLVAHATRFNPQDEGRANSCWLERWAKQADEQGTRALNELRGGVERALQILGEGFTAHPRNAVLRERLRSGDLSPTDLHGQLLRVVYRFIFLFVAEDRPIEGLPLLHPRDDSESARAARERYAAHYSTTRLRDLATRIKGSRHGDLWRQFQFVVAALSGDDSSAPIRESMALPALGSFLWNPASTSAVNDAELANHDLLEALRHLAFTRQGSVLRPVDYRNLGAEELGGVYESLLGLTPQIHADGGRFTFAEFAGNDRKTSGSYYTPDSLVQLLLDSALDPVVDQAVKGKTGAQAEQAILRLKVCDPAVGSGHFLVGAAHRLARHLARVRAQAQGESEPSPLLYQHALRDVIGRCLYGVDVNPMAAELCRVSLWLEALEPGKPLSFLDHHVRVGNSLLGATPELVARGLPDGAFKAIEGDDGEACAVLRKRNKAERTGAGPLFTEEEVETQVRLAQAAAALDELPDNRPDEVRAKERAFRQHQGTDELRQKKLLADAWCSAFVIPKYFREGGRDRSAIGITQQSLNDVAAGRSLLPELAENTQRLVAEYQFFHWHLAFPEVFAGGGFDVVVGNPPWERVKLQEQEFFAQRDPSIAAAPNAAARKRAIASLKDTNPGLLKDYREAMRQAEGESQLLRLSGRYPLCGRGDINTYAVFAEAMRDALNPNGRLGVIVPTGIATDDTTKFFFGDLVQTRTLVSYFGFKNERFLFPRPVEHTVTFGLLTLVGRGLSSDHMEFCWLAWTVDEMNDPARRIVLTAEDIERLNPNTRTCPVFRSERDAEITKSIYRRVPVLIREARGNQPEENAWGLSFGTMFHMSNDSGIFVSPEVACPAVSSSLDADPNAAPPYLPLYEAKMLHQFDHRWATYARQGSTWLDPVLTKIDKDGRSDPDTRVVTVSEKNDPTVRAAPRYWVRSSDVCAKLVSHDEDGNVVWRWDPEWLVGFRDIARNTDDRTAIATVLPRAAVSHPVPLAFLDSRKASDAACLLACLNSFVLDYVARQKVGGTHLTYFIVKQLAVPSLPNFSGICPWDSSVSTGQWIVMRVLELVYTADDLSGFARDCGCNVGPFRVEPERRAHLRRELDAAFFHLYGVPREDVAYILDTFLVFKARDEQRHGEYRTRRVILETYDDMQESIRGGRPYRSSLEPPPADPNASHLSSAKTWS